MQKPHRTVNQKPIIKNNIRIGISTNSIVISTDLKNNDFTLHNNLEELIKGNDKVYHIIEGSLENIYNVIDSCMDARRINIRVQLMFDNHPPIHFE